MVVNIIKLVASELAVLLPDVPIYRENQRGGFQEPSFFIEKLPTNIIPDLFGIQVRDNHYQLVYFPDPAKHNEDMDTMETFLSDNLTQLNDQFTLRDRSFEHSDGALLMTFRVNWRAIPVDDSEKQQRMDYRGGLKRE